MIFSDKVYKFLKWATTTVLPACAVFYKLLASTWHLPYGDEVATTITGVSSLLGACLMFGSYSYDKQNNNEGE